MEMNGRASTLLECHAIPERAPSLVAKSRVQAHTALVTERELTSVNLRNGDRGRKISFFATYLPSLRVTNADTGLYLATDNASAPEFFPFTPAPASRWSPLAHAFHL